MHKLTTSQGVFGPYASVDVLADRYRCDGADLPFAVVGDDGVIAEWDLPMPEIAPSPPPVPQEITMRQACRALLDAGLLHHVEPAIDGLPEPQRTQAQIDWQRSTTLRRDYPLVLSLGDALGLSSEDVDALFVAAAAIP